MITTMPRDLSAQLAGNLDDGFEALVRAHVDLVYGVALRMTGNAHDAEEITQDAFENAYRALKKYPDERIRALKPRPWLAQIAVNAARTRLRRKAHPTRPLGEGDEITVSDQTSDWEHLLMELPERYRLPVMLRYVEDLTYDDVAEVLGQPVGTVKTNVHRGITMLREALEKGSNDDER